jgi:hypothetical protein
MDPTDFLIADILHGSRADPLESERMPAPRAVRLQARHRLARIAQRQRLLEAIGALPAPGEAVHCTTGGKFELFTWIPEIIAQLGRADSLYCSTWTCSMPNAAELFALADAGKIGRIHFVTGLYFKRREGAVYAYLLEGLRRRGGTYRAFPNHSKVVLLAAEGQGHYLTVEGSGNFTANPQHEQETIINDRGLWEFHRHWFDEMLSAIPAEDEATSATAGKPAGPRKGFSQRRAGLGTLSVTRDQAARRQVVAWKMAASEDPRQTAAFADELAALVKEVLPARPAGCVLTIPPQGASAPGRYFARLLARRVATRLKMPLVELLRRPEAKRYHGPRAALQQQPFTVTTRPPAAIVLDDLITTGRTMALSLEALRAAGIPAWGFALNGS